MPKTTLSQVQEYQSRPAFAIVMFCATGYLTGCKDAVSPQILQGKYVNFKGLGPAPVCETIIDELDSFIERTADFLEVEPPPEFSIDYAWITDPSPETWLCSDLEADGCTIYEDDRAYVFSRTPGHAHELVHATHDLVMPGGAQILQEGLAEYLGSSDGAYLKDRAGFAELFQSLVSRGSAKGQDEYLLSLQFVGAVIERDGIEKFRSLWKMTTGVVTYEEFSSVYDSIYPKPLSEALSEIENTEIRPMAETYRTTCSAPPVQWPAQGLNTMLLGRSSKCLDRFSVVRPHPDYIYYYIRYSAQAPVSGIYHFLRPENTLASKVYIRKCGTPDVRTWINADGMQINIDKDVYIFEVTSTDVDLALQSIRLDVVTP